MAPPKKPVNKMQVAKKPAVHAAIAAAKAKAKKPAARATKPIPVAALKAAVAAKKQQAKSHTTKPSAKTTAVAARSISSPEVSPTAIASLVGQIPAPQKALALAQLQEFAATPTAGGTEYENLIASLSATMAPQLATISDALSQRVISTEATSQHNAMMDAEMGKVTAAERRATAKQIDESRWKQNAAAQTAILEAVSKLAVQVIAKDRLSKRIYAAYGVNLA